MGLDRLRIFISSPGDVAEERVLANNLVRRLSDEFEQQLRIEPVFWEHEPLLATSTFQNQIPPPRDCEVAICILWSRIGTRLPPDITRSRNTRFGAAGSRYASGTEYEFEDAASGFEEHGFPQLLVYRKTATPMADLSDKPLLMRMLEQKEALDAFIRKWFFNDDDTLRAAFHPFAHSAEFEQVLEEHLRKLIERRLPAGSAAVAPVKPSWTAGSPFRGLEVFDFEHAPVFFGRTRAIGGVLESLRKQAAAGRAFVLVLGASGSGKSSLVRAGVLPVLTQPGVVEGVGLWRRAVMRAGGMGGDPFAALASALIDSAALPELAADGATAADLAGGLRENPVAAVFLVKGGLSQAAAATGGGDQPEARLVLVVDQLEELWSVAGISTEDRARFIDTLAALARGGKVWVLATLRNDFYPRCAELPALVSLKEGAGQYDLELPDATAIAQMIRRPAQAAGFSFEEDPQTHARLDDLLRDAAAARPEVLPLLEFALEELYKQRSPQGVLMHETYRALGGIEGALAGRAENIYASLAPDIRAAMPRVFRALVNVGAGEADAVARAQASAADFASDPPAAALVEAFVAARLFTADVSGGASASIRVAHEALLRHWPRVVAWLQQDREMLRARGRVAVAASRWEAEGKRADLLLGEGKPLEEARALLAGSHAQLSDAQRAFIRASAASAARRRSSRRAVILTVLILAVAGTIASYIAYRGERRSREGQRRLLDVAVQTAHSQQLLKELRSALLLAQDVQNDQWKFVLTHDERYSHYCYEHSSQLYKQIVTIRRLVSDQPEQLKRVETLSLQCNDLVRVSSMAIDLNRSRSPAMGTDPFLHDRYAFGQEGRTSADYFRQTVAEIEAAENARLRLLTAAAEGTPAKEEPRNGVPDGNPPPPEGRQ